MDPPGKKLKSDPEGGLLRGHVLQVQPQGESSQSDLAGGSLRGHMSRIQALSQGAPSGSNEPWSQDTPEGSLRGHMSRVRPHVDSIQSNSDSSLHRVGETCTDEDERKQKIQKTVTLPDIVAHSTPFLPPDSKWARKFPNAVKRSASPTFESRTVCHKGDGSSGSRLTETPVVDLKSGRALPP